MAWIPAPPDNLNNHGAVREWMVAVSDALSRVRGGSFSGTLTASNIWVGEPGNTGSVLATTGCRVMDTTAQGSELASALNPIAYDIGQGVTFSPFGVVGNDGQLATWRPDVANDADPTAQVSNANHVHPLAFPNGAALRANAIGPASRVMMVRHSETPSVDENGDLDGSATPYWQVVAPLSLYGLMDCDIVTDSTVDDWAPLYYNATTAKWQSALPVATTTTDATTTTVSSIGLNSDAAIQVTAAVVARRTGGVAGGGAVGDTASYLLVGSYRNVGGTVTQVGTTTRLVEHEDDAAWNCDLAINGTDIEVQVTGVVDTIIDWQPRLSQTRTY